MASIMQFPPLLIAIDADHSPDPRFVVDPKTTLQTSCHAE